MAVEYPKILSALQLVEDSDDELIFCGPPSSRGESGLSEIVAIEQYVGLRPPRDHKAKTDSLVATEVKRSGQPKRAAFSRSQREAVQADVLGIHLLEAGSVHKANPKFVCVVHLAVEDDTNFCFVKRLLGKGGGNVRTIAEECQAKIRLRGIGSGFLEGSEAKEANLPLQISISCVDFTQYFEATRRVTKLVSELYKHYDRYMKSMGMQPPHLPLEVEEVRRDDHNIDVLAAKAARTPCQRAQDRKNRNESRLRKSMDDFGKGATCRDGFESGSDKNDTSTAGVWAHYVCELPGDFVPTTPAGRRAAARSGGACIAAKAAAEARKVDEQDRLKQRQQRGNKKPGHPADDYWWERNWCGSSRATQSKARSWTKWAGDSADPELWRDGSW